MFCFDVVVLQLFVRPLGFLVGCVDLLVVLYFVDVVLLLSVEMGALLCLVVIATEWCILWVCCLLITDNCVTIVCWVLSCFV